MPKTGLVIAAMGLLGLILMGRGGGTTGAPEGVWIGYSAFLIVGLLLATWRIWYRLWLRHRELR